MIPFPDKKYDIIYADPPGWDSWGNEVPTPAECEETNGQQTDRGGHEAEAAGQV